MEKKFITQEDFMNLLDTCYSKAIGGINHISPPIEKMAQDYLSKDEDIQMAAKKMLNNQIAKCTTSGFITGFGGFITLPVSIPANIGSVIYVQMRMIACTAYLSGLKLDTDQVQTMIYACLAGVSVNEIIKKCGVEFGEKFANSLIKKIPGQVLVKINQKVGFRFMTKAGETGVINLTKLIPGVGAVINGGLDLVQTKIIANRAYNWFIINDFSDKSEEKNKKKSSNIISDDEGYIDIDDYKVMKENDDEK